MSPLQLNSKFPKMQMETEANNALLHSLTCSQSHTQSVLLHVGSGILCLTCFSNLLSSPSSPTFHVSYALTQLSHAINNNNNNNTNTLSSFHIHLLISPLLHSLSNFHGDSLARQITLLISDLCCSNDDDDGDGTGEVCGEFVRRIADGLSKDDGVSFSRPHLYLLHCMGVLLTQHAHAYGCIKDKTRLMYNLVMGLQLPSEEIRGEIMFVLYKICLLQCSSQDEEGVDVLLKYCPVIFHLSLDVLMKTQRDDVRFNSIALMKVLGERGFLSVAFTSDFNLMDGEADSYMQTNDGETAGIPLCRLFAEAIKSPLLSSDTDVQIAMLDFLAQCLSRGDCSGKQIEILVEENVADYIFEILRLSDKKDKIVSSCVQILDHLSKAELVFKQRLAIGFATLVSVLPQVTGVPFHPVQNQMLKIVLNGISSFPGVVSTRLGEEISTALTSMLRKPTAGMGMQSETFFVVCSIFVSLLKCPSASTASTLLSMVQEASTLAVSASLSIYDQDHNQLLHSLYLLKEAYAFGQETDFDDTNLQLRQSVMEVCQKHILPWFVTAINDMEEETILGIMETLHFILLHGPHNQVLELRQAMLSVSWFSLSFECLGLYRTERMKLRVYLLLSSVVDLLGDDFGHPIRAAASTLPADPIDLLFLLGQKSTANSDLSSCQTAVLHILHASSFYEEMLADKKLVLASLEQYMLANSSHLLSGADQLTFIGPFLSLYGLYRALATSSYHISYSPEAEQVFFKLVSERDWDLSSADIHPTSLKWLFQQERISISLSNQILKMCQKSAANGTQLNCQTPLFQHIAQLTSVGDNLLPELMNSLLMDLVGEEMVTDDVFSLLHFLSSIIYSCPDASDQLCINGMGIALQTLSSKLFYPLSLDNYMVISRFIFIVLSSVHAQTIQDEEAWISVTMKLLDIFNLRMTANGWAEEHLQVVAVLSLVLQLSTQGALIETSKAICLNSSLTSLIKSSIGELSVSGYSIELEEGTDTEQAWILLLLLNHFYLKSLQFVLPGIINWQMFLNQPDKAFMYPSMGIHCQELCRFLHFGSPMIKLVASYTLVELLTQIANQENRHGTVSECNLECLWSVVAVLEGLVFDANPKIALNSCICLSIILKWEYPESHLNNFVRYSAWCKMIVEELAVSFAVPGQVSASLVTDHHSPIMRIATALLSLENAPPWLKSVFDEASLSGMIENLSPNNLSVEMVHLCQGLLKSAYMKPSQIAGLNHLFQASRRYIFAEGIDDEMDEHTQKTISMTSDLGEVCGFLIYLMSSEPTFDASNRRLVQEIDSFLQLASENDENQST